MLINNEDDSQVKSHWYETDAKDACVFLAEYLDKSIGLFLSGHDQSLRLLRPRLAIQLHKYSIHELRRSFEPAECEIRLLTNKLELLTASFDSKIQLPKNETIILPECEVREIDEATAFFLHEHSHYLFSARKAFIHLGLFTKKGDMLGLASYSEFDLMHLNPIFSEDIKPSNIMVLSRLIIFDGAPFNTSSYLLARSRTWITKHFSNIKVCITYLDPNVGHMGSTYLAFNATLIAEEQKKRYLYDRGEYISDRELISRYGTADRIALQKLGSSTLSESVIPLLPLRIFAWQSRPSRGQLFNKVLRLIQPSSKLTG